MACDSIENLEDAIRGTLKINIEVKGSFEKTKEILNGYNIEFLEEKNGFVKLLVLAEGEEKKTMEDIFFAFVFHQIFPGFYYQYGLLIQATHFFQLC